MATTFLSQDSEQVSLLTPRVYDYDATLVCTTYFTACSLRVASLKVASYTGKERDPTSGLDNFGARYYASTMGRFMSPDDPDNDRHLGDPQSLNLYTYGRNNPLKNIDPDGEACVVSANGSRTDDDSGGESCEQVELLMLNIKQTSS